MYSLDDICAIVFVRLGLLTSDHASLVDRKASLVFMEEVKATGRVLRARLKIYITLWQIVSILPFTLNLDFPNLYSIIASTLNVFNLNISRSSLVSCSAGRDYDAIDALVVDTVYPIVLVCVLWIIFHVHVRFNGARLNPTPMPRLRSRYFTVFLVFTYLILPFTSVKIFQVFSCRDVDPDDVDNGDDRYMTVDYSVSCASEKYQFGFVWAIVSIFVYPVGIPAFYFYELYSARHDIESRNDDTHSSVEAGAREARLKPLRFLFEFYDPKYWYWEILETLYRLLLTGVLVVISHGTAVQIVVGISVALLFLKICDTVRPYADDRVQFLKEISQWQIMLVFLVALLLAADFEAIDPIALDALFVIILFGNFILDIVLVVWRRLAITPAMINLKSKSLVADGDHIRVSKYRDPACEVENPVFTTSSPCTVTGGQQREQEEDVGDDSGVRMSVLTASRMTLGGRHQ